MDQVFQFKLIWSAKQVPSISGEVNHNLTLDASKLVSVEIRGLVDTMTDPRERLRLSADVKFNEIYQVGLTL